MTGIVLLQMFKRKNKAESYKNKIKKQIEIIKNIN